MFQESYTTEEWRTLQFAPLWVFEMTASADGKVESFELRAMEKVFSEWAQFKDPLAQEVLQSINSNLKNVEDLFDADPRRSEAGLKDVVDLLDRKTTTEQAESFKRAMLSVFRPIAKASLAVTVSSNYASMRKILGVQPSEVAATK